MKIYVYVSAAHFNNGRTDIVGVQVFTSILDAVYHLEQTIGGLISEEGG